MSETLVSKLAKASKQVGALAADKRNNEQKYNYISADKILERCGDALAENGVVVIPAVLSATYTAAEREGKNPRLDVNIVMEMTITDGEKEIKVLWSGCGSDYMTPDKALYKAITSGHKYFLMKLLNVGIGNEDGEHENGNGNPDGDTRKTTQPPARTTQPQTQPAATNGNGNGNGNGKAPTGPITPQMIVEHKLADNIPNAVALMNKLNINGKRAEEFWTRIELYRAWRDGGKDADAAAIAAIAGEIPQEG